MTRLCDEIKIHYSSKWGNIPLVKRWNEGPIAQLPFDFCILEFAPTNVRHMWTYATCCMSQPSDAALLKIHLFSPIQCELHVELLTVIAHYHCTGQTLALGHTVNFGRPWLHGSTCGYGLIALPYLDGPEIEDIRLQGRHLTVKCCWLIPITESERNYKRIHGLETLEFKFNESKFDYLDPYPRSVV